MLRNPKLGEVEDVVLLLLEKLPLALKRNRLTIKKRNNEEGTDLSEDGEVLHGGKAELRDGISRAPVLVREVGLGAVEELAERGGDGEVRVVELDEVGDELGLPLDENIGRSKKKRVGRH